MVVSDKESKYLWDDYQKEKLDGVELILSSGDLDPDYLSFLTTVSSVPVLYVMGNHDDKYFYHPPEGCICIENKIYESQRVECPAGFHMFYKSTLARSATAGTHNWVLMVSSTSIAMPSAACPSFAI